LLEKDISIGHAQKVMAPRPRQRTIENSPAIYRWDSNEGRDQVREADT
jgi:hypothetical protein